MFAGALAALTGPVPSRAVPGSPAWVAAQTAWGEARGEGVAGLQAVLNVIGNRAAAACWWGSDIVSVCRKREQFSCWNEGDPNRVFMLELTEHDPIFALALSLADLLVDGRLPDLTRAADCYFAVTSCLPAYLRHARFCVQIGRHRFYRTRPDASEACA